MHCHQPLQLSRTKLIVHFTCSYCIAHAYASASRAASHNEEWHMRDKGSAACAACRPAHALYFVSHECAKGALSGNEAGNLPLALWPLL